jgi:hypothetical protein
VHTVDAQRTESRKNEPNGSVLYLQYLLQYADEGEDTSMLNRTVTGDESWVHHYQPESKRALMQWKHPSSPSTKKLKVMSPAGKAMLTVFWYSQGVLLAYFQKSGENVNSASYCEVWLKLQDVIRRKRPDQQTKGTDTTSSWQCHAPYSPRNPRGNSSTTVGTSWISALQPGLGP